MRVLQLMASGATGGGARYLMDLMPRLRECGVECWLVTGKDGPLAGAAESLGFEVRVLDMMRGRASPTVLTKLVQILREIRPDLVHVHGTRGGLYGAIAARLAGIQSVAYTAHGIAFRKEQPLWNRVPRQLSEATICQVASGVMSVSQEDLQSLRELPRLGAWKGRYVPNAVESSRFQTSREQARTKLGVASCDYVVGTVSRLVPQKSVDVFLAAAKRVDGAKAIVIGEGELRKELEEEFGSSESEAVFLGERLDVPELLAGFDVFVLSSGWEGEPLALLEAMAAGVACVATDTPGSRAILNEGRAGLLVPVGDVNALSDAIERLHLDEQLAKSVRAEAAEVVAGRTTKIHAGQVMDVYREMLNELGGRE